MKRVMSRTNEMRFVSRHKTCACKCSLNISVYNDKKRWNSDKFSCMNKKSSLRKVGVMMDLHRILVYVNVTNHAMPNNIQIMYIVSAEKNLECKDEILNTTDTISIADEKLTCKSNCRISSAIMCLISLAIVSIGYYYYYTRYWLKKEYSMSR